MTHPLLRCLCSFPTGSLILFLTATLLASCSAPRALMRPDPLLEQYVRAGELAVQTGDLHTAARWYRSARDRAREMDAPLDVARCAYNLAVVLSEAGEWKEAEAAATEARMLFAGEPAGIVTSLALLAKIAEHQAQNETAVQLALEGLALAREATASPTEEVALRLVLARAALRRGDPRSAEQELRAISRTRKRWHNPLLEAELEGTWAAWAETTGQFAEAGRRRDAQASCYQKAGRFDAMAEALAQAAASFEAAGQTADAAIRYFRAARSRAGAGKQQSAQALLSRAEPLATAANLVALQSSIRLLQNELNASGAK